MLLWEAVGNKNLRSGSKQATVQVISTRVRSMQATDRCTANTRVGRQCRCRRAKGSNFCAFHDPEISARIRAKAKAKREARKRQLAALPEAYIKTLASPEGIGTALEHLFREVRLGVVSPRTAQVMLAIVDRLLAYDRLLKTVGPRKANRKLRALEVRQQVMHLLEDLRAPAVPDAPPKVVTGKSAPIRGKEVVKTS